MFYILLFSVFITLLLTLSYNKYFSNKNNLINVAMFKNVGSSGKTLTEVTLLFGIVSFKNDLNEEKNIACYSYRDKIKKGSRILITDYDSEKEMYVIDEYPNI